MGKPALVVEDEANIVTGLRRLLGREGFDVTSFPNGPDALNYIKQGNIPAVISMDFQIERLANGEGPINGLETALAIRKAGVGSPILFTTSNIGDIPNDPVLAPYEKIGKPFDGKEYVAKVRELLQKQQAQPQ